MNDFNVSQTIARVFLVGVIGAALAACESKFTEHPNGLRMRDLESGDSDLPPAKAGDLLVVHYTGTTPVGGQDILFYNSYERGSPVALPMLEGRVIKGFELGLAGMRPGGTRELIVPPELGYGSEGAGGVIPPDATLHFKVELVEIKTLPTAFKHGELTAHPAGFEYAILDAGQGTQPVPGDYVRLNFSRFSNSGKLIDSSRMYGVPYEFHLGQKNIPASINAVALKLKPGGRATIRVPYRLLSTVERQGIPPREAVRYDIEFIDVDADHIEKDHQTHDDADPADDEHHGHSH
jgi:FKBP-type peptidyl-prolyl cis-trans isomerase